MKLENSLTSSDVISSKRSGRTTVLFTQKALSHVLEQHSELGATEKAKKLGKVCFKQAEDVIQMGNKCVEDLSSHLEWYRKQGVKLTNNSIKNPISHLYLPDSKDWIVQLRFLKPNTFEIVSFYKNRPLKKI